MPCPPDQQESPAKDARVVLRDVDVRGIETLEVYRSRGGYSALERAVRELSPADVKDMVSKAGLRGRGGAGFPAGRKWSAIPANGDKPILVLCNADEGEPGTFKDRLLMLRLPHLLIEGIVLCAYAVGAHLGYIYLRGEFADCLRVLDRALQEARSAGYLGENIAGSNFSFELHIHRGLGAYICGDENALIASLEGRRGWPRRKPPYIPVFIGLYGCPTIVNNVETLCNVPLIVKNGADWFASMGTETSKGTKLFCLSGHVNRPGVYEAAMGTPLRHLIFDLAGGIRGGRRFKAVFPGGVSVPLLVEEHLDTPMDFESVPKAGSFLGSGGMIVMDDATCMVKVALRCEQFYASESCGQCTPCREGTVWMTQILERVEKGKGEKGDIELLLDICKKMFGQTVCPMGDFDVAPVESTIKYFREEYEEHIRRGGCPFES
jgi:NADH-quinone oxidoreductase subunit F